MLVNVSLFYNRVDYLITICVYNETLPATYLGDIIKTTRYICIKNA